MMKKEYTVPEMEIVKFETEDCITASTFQMDIDGGQGDGLEYGNVGN